MWATVNILVEVSDEAVVEDIVKALETIIPYMADNVVVRSFTGDDDFTGVTE